jgi:hypothetical protein
MLDKKITSAGALVLLALAVLAPAVAGAKGVLESKLKERPRRVVDVGMEDVLDFKRNIQERRLDGESRVINTSICPR